MRENVLALRSRICRAVLDIDASRMGMSFIGICLCAVGVGFSIFADLGVAPFQSLSIGLNSVAGLGLSYGAYCVLLNMLLLIVPLLFSRRQIGAATIINLIISGYISEWTVSGLTYMCGSPHIAVRIICLFIGILMICVSAAVYYEADLGVSPYDAVPLTVSDKTIVSFKASRIACDLGCIGIGALCGVSVGIGTVITAFFTGPLISLFQDRIHQNMAEK